MSKKNIVDQKEVGKELHVTFETHDGERTYAFKGNSRKAFENGTDPSDLRGGRLVKPKKT